VKHPQRVADYLAHIVQANARATRYVEPLQDIEAFRRNPQVQDAVVRNIEIIGEAANQIARMAPDFIRQHPELPWRKMRNMRNIVVHAYFNVDLTIVWRTVQRICPPAETADRATPQRGANCTETRRSLPMKFPSDDRQFLTARRYIVACLTVGAIEA
jgi:uncharacterized protein with HEPN domain